MFFFILTILLLKKEEVEKENKTLNDWNPQFAGRKALPVYNDGGIDRIEQVTRTCTCTPGEHTGSSQSQYCPVLYIQSCPVLCIQYCPVLCI